RFLMITAVNDPGRWAGAQYLTEEQHMRELAGKIKGATNAIPQFFQIVLPSRFQSLVPVEISYVTHRRLLQHSSSASPPLHLPSFAKPETSCLPVSLTRCIHLLFKRSLWKLSGKTYATAHARTMRSVRPDLSTKESIMTRASWIILLATVLL